VTLNFVRSLAAGGFVDVHHPEFWDLTNLSRAGLSPELRDEYRSMVSSLGEALEFMEALGESKVEDLTRVEERSDFCLRFLEASRGASRDSS
jgi:3-deoxy-7-phosphoheptulonate synthase